TDPLHHGHGGRALLFERVAGSEVPVLINAFGSYHRMELALGCGPGGLEELAGRIGSLAKPQPPSSLREMLAKARELLPLLRIPPRRRRGRGLCQEVVLTGDSVDLRRWPLLRCWPLDGDPAAVGWPAGTNEGIDGLGSGPAWEAGFRGRYITLAGIHTIHADDRDHPRPPSHNIGMYRVQMLGPRTMAMHWHLHHDGARHWRSWKARGEPMPVAVVLGGESVLPYAATAPLPPGISELLLAGFLNGRGIEMVRGTTVPLWVPANAEIVIEGWVSHEAGEIDYDPRRDGAIGPGAALEGPFGDHTGFYSLPDRYPRLTVSAITHRQSPIYPTTVVGLPIQEDYFLGKTTERLFLPLLKTIVHDIEDYDLPVFGAFHNCACVQIRKAYAMQGRRVMHSVWGAGQMAWTKTIFVVDADVDVHDPLSVLSAAGRHCQPDRDIEMVNGPLDILDHAAPHVGAGKKIGFDCTKKYPGDLVATAGLQAASPTAVFGPSDPGRISTIVMGVAGIMDCSVPADGWVLLRANKQAGGQGRQLGQLVVEALNRAGAGAPFVVVLGPDVDIHDTMGALFHWCAHTDAGRDAESVPGRAGGTMVFDATPKMAGDENRGLPVRPWPPLLKMPEEVRERARTILDGAITGVP
ncbi:MAG: UbiD family decarboxylase, partial [Phycisphaerales bacterium]